jgi:hypothetical protein
MSAQPSSALNIREARLGREDREVSEVLDKGRAADGIGQERWDPARAAGFPSVLIRICNVIERLDRCSCAPPKSSL